jgi:membrane-associated protease RseP (regulator of RpoE activity)
VNDIGLGQVKTYEEVYENKMFTSFDNGWEALGQSFVDAWIILGQMFVLLFDIITLGYVVDHDPWYSSYQGESASDVSYNQWSMLFVDLSLILFAFNIIPIPPLDGWKAAEYTYEAVTKKKVKRELVSTLTYVGYVLIAVTFVFSFIVGFI